MKNYKYIGILVLAWLFTLPAVAQLGEERHNFAVGINGGLNMNSVSFDPKIKQNTLNGMEMGVTLRYMSEKYFKMMCGVQMEINYSQRGWSEKIEDGSENTYSRTMNYVEIPLFAHLAFGKDALNRGVKFFINIHIKDIIMNLLGAEDRLGDCMVIRCVIVKRNYRNS